VLHKSALTVTPVFHHPQRNATHSNSAGTQPAPTNLRKNTTQF